MSDNRETNTLTANDGWSNQKEITIRFSKKLADGPFEAKDGKGKRPESGISGTIGKEEIGLRG